MGLIDCWVMFQIDRPPPATGAWLPHLLAVIELLRRKPPGMPLRRLLSVVPAHAVAWGEEPA